MNPVSPEKTSNRIIFSIFPTTLPTTLPPMTLACTPNVTPARGTPGSTRVCKPVSPRSGSTTQPLADVEIFMRRRKTSVTVRIHLKDVDSP